MASAGFLGLNDAWSGIVRRGPLAKIHTTPSVSPNGWHAEHAPQPLFDSRLPITPPGPSCGRFTPVELLKTALPIWIVAASVPGAGSSTTGTVAITVWVARSTTETSRETSFMT